MAAIYKATHGIMSRTNGDVGIGHQQPAVWAGFTLLTVAWPEGLEPPTHVLEGHCSIQMSYGQIVYRQGERGLQALGTVQINRALR